jgi:hypothetical protein
MQQIGKQVVEKFAVSHGFRKDVICKITPGGTCPNGDPTKVSRLDGFRGGFLKRESTGIMRSIIEGILKSRRVEE